MNTLHKFLSFKNSWLELGIMILIIVSSIVLGYASREFALDLQANFFTWESVIYNFF